MEESKPDNKKWSKKELAIVGVILLVLAYIFIFLPIRQGQINRNCKKEASSPSTPEQVQQIDNLNAQSTNPSPDYYTTVYNACVSTSNSWI